MYRMELWTPFLPQACPSEKTVTHQPGSSSQHPTALLSIALSLPTTSRPSAASLLVNPQKCVVIRLGWGAGHCPWRALWVLPSTAYAHGRGHGPGGRGVGMLSQQALLHASAVTRSVPSSRPASPPIILPARLCVAEVLQLSILRGLGNLPVCQRVQLPYHGQCFPPAAGHREGPGSTRGACTKHLLPARQASWAPHAATPHTLTSFPRRAPHPAPGPGRTGVSQRPPCSVLGHDCEPEAPCGSGNPELQQQ